MAGEETTKPEPKKGGVPGFVIFLIVVALIALLAYAGWVLWSRRRAASLGLQPPSLNPFARPGNATPRFSFPTPRSGGIVGWVNDKIRAFKNRRYASGAGYEGGREEGNVGGGRAGGASGGRYGDQDEVWDSRVGHDGYYEEQELGLQPGRNDNTSYGGAGYGGAPRGGEQPLKSPYNPTEPQREERGRSRTRELDPGFVERERTPGGRSLNDPFGDHAEASNASLRGVSPRPVVDTHAGAQKKSSENSPTERRSMFRENM